MSPRPLFAEPLSAEESDDADASFEQRLAYLEQASRGIADTIAALSRRGPTSPRQALDRLCQGFGSSEDYAALGLPAGPVRLLAVHPTSERRSNAIGQVLHGVQQIVVGQVPATDLWIVACPDRARRHHDSAARPRSRCHFLYSRCAGADALVSIGVSTPIDGPHGFRRAWEEALHASRTRPRGLVFAEDRWVDIGLERLARSVEDAIPADNPLRRLRDHDRRHSGHLTESLTEWLRADGNIAAAASNLGVHANTLRYRLRRVEEVAGLDLRDPDQRCLAYLALVSGASRTPGTAP